MQISGQRKKQRGATKPPSTSNDQRGVATESTPAARDTAPPPPGAAGAGPTRHQERLSAVAVANTPVGLPTAPTPAAPIAPVSVPDPAAPFTVDALLQHVTAPMSSEPEPPYTAAPGPKGDGHIRMMEPALAAAATVPFGSIARDGGAQLLHVLNKFGFAVVADVLQQEELAAVERMWADDLRSIVDVGSCKDEEAVKALLEDPVHRWPMNKLPLGTKFASDWGLPQGKAAWHCRAHPNVRATFAAVFGDDRLCTGMDNVFFSNVPSVPGSNAAQLSRLWPHADQNSAVKPSGRFECYQGVLYIWPATEDTSATVVWPRSHTLVYPQLMQRGSFKRHFCMLSGSEHADFARNARRVTVPPGGLLLWNSRTVHQGWPGGARLAFPICHEPASRRDHNALARKQQVVLDGMPTTHWASLGEVHRVASKDSGPLTADGITIRHAAHTICVDSSGALKREVLQFL